MENLTKGVYYIPAADKIIELSKVQIYEDRKSTFALVAWVQKNPNGKVRTYERTLIKRSKFKFFQRIGSI